MAKSKKVTPPARDKSGRFLPKKVPDQAKPKTSKKKPAKDKRCKITPPAKKAKPLKTNIVKAPAPKNSVKLHGKKATDQAPAPPPGSVNAGIRKDNREKIGSKSPAAGVPPLPLSVIKKPGSGIKSPQTVTNQPQTEKPDSGGADPSRPVGPGNPPRSGQFKPGNAVSPGRPKGSLNAKTVIKFWLGQEEELENPLKRGEFLKLTVLDVMTLGLIAKARKGDVQAFNALVDRTEGKPVQSTKLLDANDKSLQILVGFAKPGAIPAPGAKDPNKPE